jgi:protein-L-isoaspartate(D-aspartate) O-methyltransferase
MCPDLFAESRKIMVARLAANGYVRSQQVRKAMETVRRELFLPGDMKDYAYMDSPQPIGWGQTISAPHMVAIMEEELELKPGLKVLEIGGGSGYHAAVTAEIVKPEGRVFTIERIHELAAVAEKNIELAGYSEIVKVIEGDGSGGLPKEAPFDRIFVAAGAPEVPLPLVEQLAEGGVMAIPVGDRICQDLIKIRKKGGKIIKENRGGCVFVPLIGEYGYG